MQKNKGISLIVLVITIIVMIILAGSIILTLNNNGIISKASDAVDKSNQAQIRQIASIKYLEYQHQKPAGKTAQAYVEEGLKEAGIADKDIAKTIVYDNGKIITGASELAVTLHKEGVPVGKKVSGYDISGNADSYTTDGKEITFIGGGTDGTVYNDGYPQTVYRAKKEGWDYTWTYMGISEDGKALIVMDLNDSSVKDADASGTYSVMTLGGTGGWFHGVEALNTVCDKLYSTDKGKARSINWQDLVTALQYEGPKATYTSGGITVKLDTYKTIGQLAVNGNTLDLKNGENHEDTPDGVDNIYEYEVSHLYSSVATRANGEAVGDDVDAHHYKAGTDVIRKILGTLDINYWLADTCVGVTFNSLASFSIRRANAFTISSYPMYNSQRLAGDTPYRLSKGQGNNVVVRPVVELADDLTYTYDGTTITLN